MGDRDYFIEESMDIWRMWKDGEEDFDKKTKFLMIKDEMFGEYFPTNEPEFRFEELGEHGTYDFKVPGSDTIRVSDKIGSLEVFVETLLHEIHHAIQNRKVENFGEVAEMEISRYMSANDSTYEEAYDNVPHEVEAERWAQENKGRWLGELEELNELSMRDKAEDLAQRCHMGQKRRTGEPYVTHPVRVSQIAERFYGKNHPTVISSLLHDCIEDASSEMRPRFEREIKSKFGEEIYQLVMDMTHEKIGDIDKVEDYASYFNSLSGNALILKMCDMLNNLMDNPSEGQKIKYGSILKMVGDKPPEIDQRHWDEIQKAVTI